MGMRAISGQYVGDGNNPRRIVTGLSGQIISAIVRSNNIGIVPFAAETTAPIGGWLAVNSTPQPAYGVGADGADFLVSGALNALNQPYYWTASSE